MLIVTVFLLSNVFSVDSYVSQAFFFESNSPNRIKILLNFYRILSKRFFSDSNSNPFWGSFKQRSCLFFFRFFSFKWFNKGFDFDSFFYCSFVCWH